MTIDTSRKAVERLARDHMTVGDNPDLYAMGRPHHWKTAQVLTALLAERDAALAEVARLSTPPDDAEVAELVMYLRTLVTVGTGQVTPLRRRAADALTRLSHALAAETAKREAMEAEIIFLRNELSWNKKTRAITDRLSATLAKHGSKT